MIETCTENRERLDLHACNSIHCNEEHQGGEMFFNEIYDDCGTCCSWIDDEEEMLAPDVEFRHGK
jgi:hypothetical protein